MGLGSSILLGSSKYSLIRTSSVTASRPSSRRWSYVQATLWRRQPSVVKRVKAKDLHHDGTNDDLTIHDDRLLFDGVHAENSGLREVETGHERCRGTPERVLTLVYRTGIRTHHRWRS